MSFILDALKKAEAERNRHIAPVLMDARVAPPRRGLPAWAWVLGAVLMVNLAVLGWLLWRTPAPGTVQVGTAVAAGEQLSGAASARASVTVPAPAPVAPEARSAPAATAPLPTISPPAPPLPPARPADLEHLPTLQELRTAGIALPDLQLNLHVYDPAPAYRSVLLNGQRLREGEYTPNGVKVEYITPAGVVLEAAGRRFRLDVEG